MIPLKDNIPTRRFPVVTVLLIAANVACFAIDHLTRSYQVAVVQIPDGRLARVQIPVGGLAQHYSLIPGLITTDFRHYWTTIFSSLFLHANWLHIGGNMLYLWIFGNNVEDTLGRTRFLAFYVLCGGLAAMAHVYSGPLSPVPTVGASGAVAGLMGAYLVLFPKAEILTIVPIFFIGTVMDVPAIVVIGFWAVFQFINATWLGGGEMLRGAGRAVQGGGVAYFAHIGGFFAGIILILLLGGRRLVEKRRREENEEFTY